MKVDTLYANFSKKTTAATVTKHKFMITKKKYIKILLNNNNKKKYDIIVLPWNDLPVKTEKKKPMQ